jgi:Spy/CpxP family protein refolding chaperone
LKDEQHATLEKIAADLREADKAARAKEADGGGPRDETKAAYAELAAGVKAGKIDVSKMAPHYAAIENGAKQKYEREAEALGQLYAALEPAQRTTLVANLRAAEEKRSVRVKALGARDAGRPDAVRMRLARYTHELKLESDQQRRVEANLPKEDASSIFRDEEAKELEAVVAAFENEGFDPKKIESSLPKKARAAVEDEAKFLAVLVPVLKPDQRELLAKHLARRSGALRPFQPRNSLMGVGGRGHDDGAGDTP